MEDSGRPLCPSTKKKNPPEKKNALSRWDAKTGFRDSGPFATPQRTPVSTIWRLKSRLVPPIGIRSRWTKTGEPVWWWTRPTTTWGSGVFPGFSCLPEERLSQPITPDRRTHEGFGGKRAQLSGFEPGHRRCPWGRSVSNAVLRNGCRFLRLIAAGISNPDWGSTFSRRPFESAIHHPA